MVVLVVEGMRVVCGMNSGQNKQGEMVEFLFYFEFIHSYTITVTVMAKNTCSLYSLFPRTVAWGMTVTLIFKQEFQRRD